MRRLFAGTSAWAVLGATLAFASPAIAQPGGPLGFSASDHSMIEDAQWRGRGFRGGARSGFRPGFAGRGFGGYGFRGRGRGYGGAAAAGIAGLAAGAIIGGALASQPQSGYGYPGYGYADQGYGYGYAEPGYAYAPAYAQTVPVGPGGGGAYCESTYRSYDPASGTYLGYDGLRHPCP